MRPAFKPATPVGAVIATRLIECRTNSLNLVDFPVPATAGRKQFRPAKAVAANRLSSITDVATAWESCYAPFMNDQPGGMPGKPALLWFICLLLPIAYVLSFGPAGKMRDAYQLPNEPFIILYGPVYRFSAHCDYFDRFMRWYVYEVWHCTRVLI